jgi:tetratricopeptide (TPR) repeat protein
MKVNGGSCPSLETIGAFVDGRFKDREREVVAEHLASCEACYFVFTESARLRALAEPPVPVPIPARRITWAWAASGLAAAASIVFAVNLYFSGARAEDAALEELVAAVGTARGFDARLTGGFAYAPVRTIRSGGGDSPALSPDARIVVARIEKEYATEPASRVQAVAALVSGNADYAVALLTALSGVRTNDARLLSDLAAAHLVRAERTNSQEDNARALAAANRALEIDRQLPEALFNRALALERLQMNAEARNAWEAYLTIDDRSGWGDEARARLRILSNQP